MKRSTRSRNAGKKLANTSPDLSVNGDAYKYCLSKTDPDYLVKRYIDEFIGYGVFVTKTMSPSSFICEYPGDIITEEERNRREEIYTEQRLGSYVFDIEHDKKMYYIDATHTFEKIGRYINDSKLYFNAKMVVVFWDERPHLCLFASNQGIAEGTEVRYSYGPIKGASWRKKSRYLKPFMLEEVIENNEEKDKGVQDDDEKAGKTEDEENERYVKEDQCEDENECDESFGRENEANVDFQRTERTQNDVTEIFDETDVESFMNVKSFEDNIQTCLSEQECNQTGATPIKETQNHLDDELEKTKQRHYMVQTTLDDMFWNFVEEKSKSSNEDDEKLHAKAWQNTLKDDFLALHRIVRRCCLVQVDQDEEKQMKTTLRHLRSSNFPIHMTLKQLKFQFPNDTEELQTKYLIRCIIEVSNLKSFKHLAIGKSQTESEDLKQNNSKDVENKMTMITFEAELSLSSENGTPDCLSLDTGKEKPDEQEEKSLSLAETFEKLDVEKEVPLRRRFLSLLKQVRCESFFESESRTSPNTRNCRQYKQSTPYYRLTYALMVCSEMVKDGSPRSRQNLFWLCMQVHLKITLETRSKRQNAGIIATESIQDRVSNETEALLEPSNVSSNSIRGLHTKISKETEVVSYPDVLTGVIEEFDGGVQMETEVVSDPDVLTGVIEEFDGGVQMVN
uniref:SET domain-containing protein n=1 Tax=Clytia hemisphaerica TaxID=252671 RepID=A0A7M5VEN4_9CNID